MNNRINPYQNASLQLYHPAAQRSTDRTAEGGGTREAPVSASPSGAATVAVPAEAEHLHGLSQAEQQLINRYFPASEAMTLRVYGANRATQTINPGAVGTRLDVSG